MTLSLVVAGPLSLLLLMAYQRNLTLLVTLPNIFSEVCKPNSTDQDKFLCTDFNSKFADYTGDWVNCAVQEDVVAKCISRLQRGKAPGLDGVMSEHIIYAHPIICHALARLFTAMLKHGYVPHAFGLGVVIRILKDDSGDRTKPDNYRGITLSPLISKLFEICLLEMFYDYVY